MHEANEATPLERARAAAAAGDWQDAYELLRQVDARTTLVGPDLALLAGAAYAAGHLDVTIEAWERVHRASVQAGDHLAAAGAAVASPCTCYSIWLSWPPCGHGSRARTDFSKIVGRGTRMPGMFTIGVAEALQIAKDDSLGAQLLASR